MSRKWITEKVVQRYFRESHEHYQAPVGGETTTINSVRYNDRFDHFPDEYAKIGGREYPVEVEWKSSDFDHFDHPQYDEFVEEDGFVVVIEQDESFEDFAQLELDTDHLEDWVIDTADELLKDTLSSIRDARGNGRHPLLEKGEPRKIGIKINNQGNGNLYYKWQWRENGEREEEHWQPVPEPDRVLYYFSRVSRPIYKDDDPDEFPMFGES